MSTTYELTVSDLKAKRSELTPFTLSAASGNSLALAGRAFRKKWYNVVGFQISMSKDPYIPEPAYKALLQEIVYRIGQAKSTGMAPALVSKLWSAHSLIKRRPSFENVSSLITTAEEVRDAAWLSAEQKMTELEQLCAHYDSADEDKLGYGAAFYKKQLKIMQDVRIVYDDGDGDEAREYDRLVDIHKKLQKKESVGAANRVLYLTALLRQALNEQKP